jgi:predicted porin
MIWIEEISPVKKNIIIAGTALATVLATAPAFAAEPIKLSVGGFGGVMVGYASQDDDYLTATGVEATGVDVKGNNEIHFTGETTLDNGLTVSVLYELESGGRNSSDDVADTYQISVSGGFGTIWAGANGTALSAIAVSAPSVGDLQEGDVADGLYIVIPNSANFSLVDASFINTSGDSESLTYISPAIAGFTFGASYVPDVNGDDAPGQPVAATGATGSNEGYGAGLAWDGTFGGVGIKAEGGYLWADAGPNAVNAGTSYNAGREEWQAGAELSYAGFAFGGAYRDISQDRKASSGNTLAGLGERDGLDGNAWSLGASYTTGPYSMSLAYLESSMENTGSTVSDDELKVWELAGKYAMGPGIDLVGIVSYADFENGTAQGSSTTVINSNQNNGFAVTTGLSLSF